jgi:nucleotide-binding universal stress UspA family protein
MLKGHIGRTIADYAAEAAVDCIVIGSHRPGLTDYFLGSTAARVVRHAPCAVHVLRPRA